jgi:uncharacterized protein (DUF4213/DUF364 family)
MWEVYDDLIAAIPSELQVDETICGTHWTMARCGDNVGLAMNLPQSSGRPRTLPFSCEGMRLRDLAEYSKSWNFDEAALGLAAINAFFNSPSPGAAAATAINIGDNDSFTHWRERARGKKVAVIGHFPYLERKIGDETAALVILEKRPSEGDYPDSACEYLLPQQDFVFATGVTLVNKTLPRLLELSCHCGVILSGPSVPLAPVLFEHGVIDLQGFIVTDIEKCKTAASEPCYKAGGLFHSGVGKRVSLTK